MEKVLPHPDQNTLSIACAVITVSDTRTQENDQSGSYIKDSLTKAGHKVIYYYIVRDEVSEIEKILLESCPVEAEVVIFNGGTGIAPRDTTYDAIAARLEKVLSGFGELFRYLSYQEIGSRAMASRAIAGVYQDKLIWVLPGSTGAVKLAMEKLIQPELRHLMSQLKGK